MNSVDKTTNIIRSIGIVAIILAAINFMVGGRYDLNSLDTHYMFLGVNIVLAVLGFVMGKVFKDYKSSRTFFSLSLSMVPVHMAQLGGFIYSKFTQIPNTLPKVLQVSLSDNSGILLCSAITIAVLIPIVSLGFNILNRDSAKKHGLLFSLASILMLIPSRNANITYIIVFTSLILNYIYAIRGTKSATFEAKLSTLIVFLPALLMLGRLAYYPIDTLFIIITSASIAIASFYFQRGLKSQSALEVGLSTLGWISLFVLSISLERFLNLPGLYYVGLIFGTLILISSFYSKFRGKAMRVFSTIVITVFIFPGFVLGSIYQDLILISFPLVGLISAVKTKEKTSFIVSSITLSTSIILISSQIITFPSLGAWQTLIISGIVLILTAGLYDRKKTIIKNYCSQLKGSLK